MSSPALSIEIDSYTLIVLLRTIERHPGHQTPLLPPLTAEYKTRTRPAHCPIVVNVECENHEKKLELLIPKRNLRYRKRWQTHDHVSERNHVSERAFSPKVEIQERILVKTVRTDYNEEWTDTINGLPAATETPSDEIVERTA